MDLIYKELPITFTTKSSEAGKPTTFEGSASTFGNIDLHGDVIEKGAFTESLKRIKPKMLWQHCHDELIGGFDEIVETTSGLLVKGRLAQGVQRADEAAALLKQGFLDSMSIGFRVVDMEQGKKANYIKKVDLYEISLVTHGANPQALISGVKSLRVDIARAKLIDNERDFEKMLRESGIFSRDAATHLAGRMSFKQGEPAESIPEESKPDASAIWRELALNELRNI